MFTISLIQSPKKKGKTDVNIGQKYSFMIDQLHDGKISSKELYIYPNDLLTDNRSDLLLLKSSRNQSPSFNFMECTAGK